MLGVTQLHNTVVVGTVYILASIIKSMPLDAVAQRYAQTLFVDELERLSREHATRTREVIAGLAQRNILPNTAGLYYSEMERLGLEHIGNLADAKVNSLLAAHEHAKAPIDDQAVVDINREAVEFCDAQGQHLTRNVQDQVARNNMPSDMGAALTGTIEAGISGVKARIYRRLVTKRDEQIMAARSVPFSTAGTIAPMNTGTPKARPDGRLDHRREKIAAFIFGVVFVVVMLYINLYVPNPTETQWFTFRVVLALAAAGVGALLPGLLSMTVPPYIRAGGALALFIVVYWFNPPKLVTTPPEDKKSTLAPLPAQQQPNLIRQTTTGAGSPAIQGVQGDVSVTVEQNPSKTQSPATREKKVQPKNEK